MICALGELTPEQFPLAGGKGGTLARLRQAGYPVPDGFVVLPAAFTDDELKPEAWARVQAHLTRMRKGDGQTAFAIRSSALSEDSARASFAGEFETMLDVRADDAIREAIDTVRRSRHGERVLAYSQAQDIDADHEVAVVVQRMVPADLSGVLFTADPVSGNLMVMPGNFVPGLGDALVSGVADSQSFTFQRPNGHYDGPPELTPFARKLYTLASRLEEDLAGPQDIEWSIADGQLYLLQARPITTMQAHDPATGEWNDSLTGAYLWTSANTGEAFPDVMTPFTWSIVQMYLSSNGVGFETTRYPLFGNIGRRLYMNQSLALSALAALGLPWEKFIRARSQVFGRLPAGIQIPLVPYSRGWVLGRFLPLVLRYMWMTTRLRRRVPAFIAETPAKVEKYQTAIRVAQTTADLLALWWDELREYTVDSLQLLLAGLTEYRTLSRKLHVEFEDLVGDADANALLSGVSTGDDHLASLGPLMGLIQVSRGEMSREEYLQEYGHRGPHEMEISIPRPVEDPGWLDRQLADLDRVDVPAMLAKQRRRHEAAWERLQARVSPRKAQSYRRRLDRMAAASKTREASRSEMVRALGVLRAFALRAGELTGLGGDVFFLSLGEVLDVLAGDASAVAFIPARKETYARYSALPPYPAVICGRFDPFQWAADPARRSDFHDARAPGPALATDAITGFAGAAGHVEGLVRCLGSPEEGHLLQPGEVLVAVTTNVGWTPVFPRAAAIVTDVGAPFSHAAIVARELGIPAVVGCGDATMRLRTGDRVLVDGGQGAVQILQSGSSHDSGV